jgi:hypothetical protein
MFEFPLLNDGLEDIRPTGLGHCSRQRRMFERRLGCYHRRNFQQSRRVDNGQIDESASEQCMSTDIWIFMTDIRDAIKPVVEYLYKESWANRDLLGTVTPVAYRRLPF